MDDGDNLLKQCNSTLLILDQEREQLSKIVESPGSIIGAGICMGMVRGIIGTNHEYAVKTKTAFFCLPIEGIKYTQAVRVVVKYLKEHPEKLHESAASLAIASLTEAFPCQPALSPPHR